MNKLRLILTVLLIAAGSALIILLVLVKPKTPLDHTYAPAFQLLGRSTKTLDRALTRVIPVNEVDEARYGEAIAQRYESPNDKKSPEGKYLNDLMKDISGFKKKKFAYRVFVVDNAGPNAFAMPGGVIFVTRGLLSTLRSESELAAILAHEMGHIELGHCFDAVRFELLSRKIGNSPLWQLADVAVRLMLRHSFSKSQEAEADGYSYDLILNTDYTPSAVGMAFTSFLEWEKKEGRGGGRSRSSMMRDYYATHPDTKLRAEKYSEQARIWWKKNRGEKKYIGAENLKKLTAYGTKKFEKEYVKK